MKHIKKIHARRLAAVCAAAVMAVGAASVVYAADVGGIQRSIQLWINGDQTDAVLNIQDGSYSITYQDEHGVSHEVYGGGVAIDDDGSERPLTEAEIMEQLDGPDVQYREDGSVWVCCHGGEIEITDRFDENGVCYVQLNTGSGSLYMTIKYHGCFSYSPHSYISPSSFSAE